MSPHRDVGAATQVNDEVTILETTVERFPLGTQGAEGVLQKLLDGSDFLSRTVAEATASHPTRRRRVLHWLEPRYIGMAQQTMMSGPICSKKRMKLLRSMS
mmetsp:Transcript_58636/g.153585  ORF Transcript_58636/g.153585 Transcript_58636/m.153585 type:complete len:101 (-) Transcript_58636:2754-3056(-)